MKNEITWKTSQGQNAIVTIELTLEKEIFTDGHTTTIPACEFSIIATVDGNEMGWGEPKPINHPIAAAIIGRLALTKENFDRVKDAIAEIKNFPEYKEFLAREKAAIAADLEYEKSTAAIEAALNR